MARCVTPDVGHPISHLSRYKAYIEISGFHQNNRLILNSFFIPIFLFMSVLSVLCGLYISLNAGYFF
jgi:hypothetical protein